MRVGLGLLACLGACSFEVTGVPEDGAVVPPDVTIDAPETPPDMQVERAVQGLVAIWRFDETSGVMVDETSGVGMPVHLQAAAPVTWSAGTMTVSTINTIASTYPPNLATRLSTACVTGEGVTLEAWVHPTTTTQGSATAPAMVAGLSASINSRNVALMQAGSSWLGRVRTSSSGTMWANGEPGLLSSPVADQMTHLILVADATTRALYVDGTKLAETAAGVPTGWDGTYRMLLANELSGNRPWLGTYALVAMYSRALSPQEIADNFAAGPSAP